MKKYLSRRKISCGRSAILKRDAMMPAHRSSIFGVRTGTEPAGVLGIIVQKKRFGKPLPYNDGRPGKKSERWYMAESYR
ncbi:MAG: hypothetical protein COZ49_01130 [Candidatus Yonathbacteria bacterium CG_4_10_14_3_um_filter_47_65]|uniref:Uncharacterized protein n=2 Tax=Parcubacteria group TaxID=1794811 RepID=A0A2M8D9F1_9BACT|nr:MAG: hypothetical protein AUJ44_03005 [Candidatus Nomurabacteria bacterium CG1_02_47_685]PIP03955.1 MAG: hypothetical protein COX54_01510 [Candidatus Yonathbacteria bacterium CG23_combo_of_CG06-09_8_20_14_all_46_18]PIQ33238.1 MAG: hypothetical protein COW61_00265 [Candidatus Yonathbacteria bacterium CG17_big_fil_post_rev_8_21_14_2_50_46_19]PIX56570.1 MAG: hypothetical protein COZ49_01130 [Candidatus Yonathbacteria bacterium CG_4_10_14_3_um_filter_47_65]PIY57433.1 MAG: hypothetical protein CO